MVWSTITRVAPNHFSGIVQHVTDVTAFSAAFLLRGYQGRGGCENQLGPLNPNGHSLSSPCQWSSSQVPCGWATRFSVSPWNLCSFITRGIDLKDREVRLKSRTSIDFLAFCCCFPTPGDSPAMDAFHARKPGDSLLRQNGCAKEPFVMPTAAIPTTSGPQKGLPLGARSHRLCM